MKFDFSKKEVEHLLKGAETCGVIVVDYESYNDKYKYMRAVYFSENAPDGNDKIDGIVMPVV